MHCQAHNHLAIGKLIHIKEKFAQTTSKTGGSDEIFTFPHTAVPPPPPPQQQQAKWMLEFFLGNV